MTPFSLPAWLWQPVFLMAIVVGTAIAHRVQRGKRLYAYGEKPPLMAAAAGVLALAVWGSGLWLSGETGRTLTLVGVFGVIAAQFLLGAREGQREAFVLYEKGLSFKDVPRWRYVPWGNFDRFAWEHDSLVLSYRGESIGPRGEQHRLLVPADKRSEVEAVIATRVEAARS
jgi:hypothetical protein